MAKKIIGQPTLNGKPIDITDSWSKMKFSQYLRILKLKDDTIELLSILTGLEYETLKKAQIKGVEKILYIAKFVNTPPNFPTEPRQIGSYRLPLNSKGIFDIQMESLAQFEDMRQVMNETKAPYKCPTCGTIEKLWDSGVQIQCLDAFHNEPVKKKGIYEHTEAYATYCAMYLQKLRDGDYDGETALKMVPELMEYPASDIITAGGFFFVKLRILLYGTVSNSQSTARHRRKSIGKRSSRSSARTHQLTRRQGH